jgi:hypothetical protein
LEVESVLVQGFDEASVGEEHLAKLLSPNIAFSGLGPREVEVGALVAELLIEPPDSPHMFFGFGEIQSGDEALFGFEAQRPEFARSEDPAQEHATGLFDDESSAGGTACVPVPGDLLDVLHLWNEVDLAVGLIVGPAAFG